MVVSAACSDRSAPRCFFFGDNAALGHLWCGDTEVDTISVQDMTIVATITVDEIVSCTGLNPNVIKIDVEGAELEVLQGARNTLVNCKPRILLSVHSDSLRIKCLEYLSQYGYVCKPLGCDALIATEWVAVSS